MKRPSILIPLGAAVLTLGFFTSCSEKEQTPVAQDPFGRPVAVETVVAQARGIEGEELLLTGTLVANEAADIYSEQSGIITGIRFQEGKRVERGQVLLTVNNNALRAQARSLESELQLARDIEGRQKRLLEIGGISQQEYEAAVNSRVAVEARIETLQAQLAEYSVRAPFSGRVGLRQVSQGAYITPGTKITTLVDLDPIKLDFSVPGEYASEIKTNDTVRFVTEGSPEVHTAIVYALEPGIDAATRSLLVRARTPNPSGKLLPGAFAEIRLRVGQGRRSILLPSEAIVMERDSQRVYTVENGRAVLVNVETGVRQESLIEVKRGLQDGDTVVVRGLLLLRNGAPVAPTPATEPSSEAASSKTTEEPAASGRNPLGK